MGTKHILDYDDNFELYVKKGPHAMGDMYTSMPGLKLGVEVEEEGHTSLDLCKYECLESKTCSAFSYSARSQYCVQSQVPVHIGSDWDYYEKKLILGKPQLEMDNELAHKEHLNQQRAVLDAKRAYRDRLNVINQDDKS